MTNYERALATVPQPAQRLIAALDGVSIWSGKAAAWLLLPMVAALVSEVVMRYCFHSPTIWAMDIAVMMYGINFMISSPFCLQTGGHIRMDFFYSKWSVRRKAGMDLIMYVLLFFPAHIWFLAIGWDFFYASYQVGERSILSPWMPLLWPMKLAIPVSMVIILLQGLSETIKCWFRFKTGENLWRTETEEASVLPGNAAQE